MNSPTHEFLEQAFSGMRSPSALVGKVEIEPKRVEPNEAADRPTLRAELSELVRLRVAGSIAPEEFDDPQGVPIERLDEYPTPTLRKYAERVTLKRKPTASEFVHIVDDDGEGFFDRADSFDAGN